MASSDNGKWGKWTGVAGTLRNLSQCLIPGVSCDFEPSGQFPDDTPTHGTSPQQKWYALQMTGAPPVDCTKYTLDECEVKSYNPTALVPQQCEVYLGKCTSACAVQNGNVAACINSTAVPPSKCFYVNSTGLCGNLPFNYPYVANCSIPNDCTSSSNPCNQFFANQTGCLTTSLACTWITYDPTLTDQADFCMDQYLVSWTACINTTTNPYTTLRTCNVGDGTGESIVKAGLEGGCTPESLQLSGQSLSLDDCMVTVDVYGNECIYVDAGSYAQMFGCYSPLDPNVGTFYIEYESLQLNIITRDVYASMIMPEYVVICAQSHSPDLTIWCGCDGAV